MSIIAGLFVVTIAGILQGSFFLPMTYAKKWDWPHKWFAFSLFGMLAFNWIIALISIDNVTGIIAQIPSSLLLVILFFGLGWGIGAILFGKGMDILGMALGYPIIMGINAAARTIIPALIFSPSIFLQTKGLLIIVGTIANVVYCLFLIKRTKNFNSFFNEHKTTNWLLMVAMSLMWIGSFYFYGIGSTMLGDYGLIIGWPLLITLSIVVGNIWGLYWGEWKIATTKFGGENLQTLYISTAREGLTEEQLLEFPLSGGVFSYLHDIEGIKPCFFKF
jgi:hypothetical protein